MTATGVLTQSGTRVRNHIDLIGKAHVIKALNEDIGRIAQSDAKVLVTGESGVGKEIVARAIHMRSARMTRTYALVNCAGLPETLLESELFGHVKGSFTGAYRDKPGKLEAAHGGTVFLDEVGEMTLRMQGMLLRFLETGELQKVGADTVSRRVDVRIVAATNRDLPSMVKQGQFREDLYYRLNVIHLTVPPLRERREDIPDLVEHFLDHFRKVNRSAVTSVSPEAMDALRQYSWPGNVRELENIIERLVVTGTRDTISRDDLPPEVRAGLRTGERFRGERRRTIVDDLYEKLIQKQEPFWATVYPMFMDREITKANLRELVRRGLVQTRGNYKILARLFNMPPSDYKRFLSFLRKHGCQVPFKEFR